jgi:hypothetical protein
LEYSYTEVEQRPNHGPFIVLLVIYFISLLFSSTSFLRELRYIKYIVAFLAPFFVLPKRSYFKYVDELYYKNLFLIVIMLTYSFLTIFIKRDLYQNYFEESVFITTPILFGFFLFKYYDIDKKEFYVKFLFWAISITYIVAFFSPDRGTDDPILVNPINLFLKAEKTRGISTHGLYYGYFIIYFALKKNKKYLIFSILFFLLASKRIAMGALLINYFIYRTFNKNDVERATRKFIPILMVIINLILVWVLFKYTSGEFNNWIFESTGTESGDLTTGRFWIYKVYVDNYIFNWSGDGFGIVTKTLSDTYGMKYNFHSDVLKNFMEFGPIVFCIWIFYFYKINTRNLNTLMVTFYTNILFVTDNVFIYFDVLFLFYFFISIFIIEQNSEYEEEYEAEEIQPAEQ